MWNAGPVAPASHDYPECRRTFPCAAVIGDSTIGQRPESYAGFPLRLTPTPTLAAQRAEW